MATSPANTNRLFDGGIGFVLGINSFAPPASLAKGQLAWAVNAWLKGGIPYTRPGYDTMFRLPDGKAQGFCIFTPQGSLPLMVAAVSGKLYSSSFPYNDYSRIENIQFNDSVDHIIFKECLQGADAGVALITPRRLLMMQDGRSKAAYFDGSTGRHLNPGGTTNETVLGFQMEWVGSRLWVARDNEIFASDIFDPLHFTETQYLAEGGSLQAIDGRNITAMIRTATDEALL